MSHEKGLIMVNTGDGKGKSTAGFGLALRSLGHGRKVCLIQFMKGNELYGEAKAMKELLPMLRLEQTGTSSFVDRDNPDQIDIEEAERGLALAKEALDGSYDLVILDEINVAMDFGLISTEQVIRLLEAKSPIVDVLLTGRYAASKVCDMADMVSEVKEVKHHFAKGIPAKAGIEF